MSDDEGEAGTATSSSRRNNADSRTPRFSWNLAYEDTFFRSLCESMQLGYKENHSFKAGAWERAAIALRDKHGAYPQKSHLINKADNARKKFRMWRGLREDPDFLYNPTNRMVTASEEVWQRHFEREPLSKALRGRPFDHERYMEILFPDVIGSGGAPKRIMKPRRRTADGTLVSRSSIDDNTVIDPLLDSPTSYSQTPSQASSSRQQLPTTSIAQPTQRPPSSTTIPSPPSSTAQHSSVLTPPDEHGPSSSPRVQKRPHPEDPSAGSSPDRRRGRPGRPPRFSTTFYAQQSTPAGTTTTPTTTIVAAPPQRPSPPQPQPASSLAQTTTPSTSRSLHPSFSSTSSAEESLLSLVEGLRSKAPGWPEQALEIFFREFVDEDADLQLKIAEKALSDETKAMIFVKMTPLLRRHWVGRLREIHIRNLGGGGLGLGGLGRVGEESS